MPTDAYRSVRPPALDDELAALLATRRELGAEMEAELTAAFLARVEQALAARLEAESSVAERRNRFTQRIAWSLGLGIPLVTVAGLTGGVWAGGADGSPFGAFAGMVATLAAIIGINAYYTEVEKELELARLRRGRR